MSAEFTKTALQQSPFRADSQPVTSRLAQDSWQMRRFQGKMCPHFGLTRTLRDRKSGNLRDRTHFLT